MLQEAGMAGNVIINFIKNDIAVLVSCNDNLWRATTQLLIDNRLPDQGGDGGGFAPPKTEKSPPFCENF
jgi:hypothetical protein